MLERINSIHASKELLDETLAACREAAAGMAAKETYTANVAGMTRTYNNRKKSVGYAGRNAAKFAGRLNRWAVAAAACGVVVVLSSGAALAYNAVTGESIVSKVYKTTNTASSLNYASGVTDANGNSYIYDGMVKVDEVRSDKNLTVTLDSYVIDGSKAEVMFTVKTNDGTALNPATDDEVPVVARDRFESLSVTINGAKTVLYNNETSYREDYVTQYRVDDGSDDTQATIRVELNVASLDTLDGATLHFQLGDYTSYYEVCESVGFAFSSVADMIDGVTLAGDESITGDSIMYGYADSTVVLAPGSLHIEFSDRYPGSYIDNAGFTTKETTSGKPSFIMTIVPADDTAATELTKLNFQNTTTGLLERYNIKTLDDGRIQLTYSADADTAFSQTNSGIYHGTDVSHLSSLVLKNTVSGNEKKVISSSQCEMSFMCGTSDAAIAYDSDIYVQDTYYTGTTINVKSVTISTTELAMTGYISYAAGESGLEFSSARSYSPIVTMKNGTTFAASSKGAEAGADKDGNWYANWYLETYVDTADIESITWHGAVIYENR